MSQLKHNTIGSDFPVTHRLKALPRFFGDVLYGIKRFEVRKRDRNFQVGDYINLCEWDVIQYTGRCVTVRITHMLTPEEMSDIESPLNPGFVLLSIALVNENFLYARIKAILSRAFKRITLACKRR